MLCDAGPFLCGRSLGQRRFSRHGAARLQRGVEGCMFPSCGPSAGGGGFQFLTISERLGGLGESRTANEGMCGRRTHVEEVCL